MINSNLSTNSINPDFVIPDVSFWTEATKDPAFIYFMMDDEIKKVPRALFTEVTDDMDYLRKLANECIRLGMVESLNSVSFRKYMDHSGIITVTGYVPYNRIIIDVQYRETPLVIIYGYHDNGAMKMSLTSYDQAVYDENGDTLFEGEHYTHIQYKLKNRKIETKLDFDNPENSAYVEHDDHGNLISSIDRYNTIRNTRDEEGRVVKVTINGFVTAEYEYDHDGTMLSKTEYRKVYFSSTEPPTVETRTTKLVMRFSL